MHIGSSVVLADMWDTNGHMGGGWWVVMMLWWLFFSVAVVVGMVWLVRGGSFESWRAPRRETPVEALDRRFAEGEISVDEYRERRRVLTGDRDATVTDTGEPVSH